MGEIVNVLVAFAVIVFFFRWIASGSSSAERSAADTLGFRPRNVTQDMVDTISNMFPDVPIDNIRYDLMRTGNIELTTNKILERGYLDAPPPAYYTVHPRQNNTSNSTRPPPGSGFSTGMHNKAQESLINRYSLQERVASAEVVPEEDVGGKAVWEDTPERREASLRERKARMILAARQRLMAQQKNAAESGIVAVGASSPPS